MANDASSGGEMDSSYGSDSSDSTDTSEPSEPTDSVDQENEDAGEQTAVISNKILSPNGDPVKEGADITMTVVKNYGDESEVKCSPKMYKSETESTPAEDFAAMDQEKA